MQSGTYIHTYIPYHTYIHTIPYVHTYIMHTCIHMYVCTYVHIELEQILDSFVRIFAWLFTYLYVLKYQQSIQILICKFCLFLKAFQYLKEIFLAFEAFDNKMVCPNYSGICLFYHSNLNFIFVSVVL